MVSRFLGFKMRPPPVRSNLFSYCQTLTDMTYLVVPIKGIFRESDNFWKIRKTLGKAFMGKCWKTFKRHLKIISAWLLQFKLSLRLGQSYETLIFPLSPHPSPLPCQTYILSSNPPNTKRITNRFTNVILMFKCSKEQYIW